MADEYEGAPSLMAVDEIVITSSMNHLSISPEGMVAIRVLSNQFNDDFTALIGGDAVPVSIFDGSKGTLNSFIEIISVEPFEGVDGWFVITGHILDYTWSN